MKINLENICKVREAKLDINGVTVIAGENNTGKSTVGKMLYTVVKAMYEMDYYFCEKVRVQSNRIDKALINYLRRNIREQSREQFAYMEKIIDMFDNVISDSRKNVQDISDENFADMFIKAIYDKSKRIDRIVLDILILKLTYKDVEVVEPVCHQNDMREFLYRIFQSEDYNLSKLIGNDVDEILQNYIEIYGDILDINRLSSLLDRDEIQRILELSNELEKIIKNQKLEALMSDSFAQILKSEFLSGVIELDSEKEVHIVELENDFYKKCKINIKKKEIEVSKIDDWQIYNEVTYIESPIFLYLNYFEAKELKGISSHINDLIQKLSNDKGDREEDLGNCNLDEIITGNFSYDGVNENFVYKENSTPYKMTNVANGTKAFGILQMLNEKGWLSSDNIMIIDEPEVHLHPKWQVEYCKIISALARKGIRFVITTHSPYIVQAIKKFTSDFGITKDVNFYLSEETEDGVIIRDKTNKLGDIYEKLTAPLREIM